MKIILGLAYLILSFCTLIMSRTTDYGPSLLSKIMCWVFTICAGILGGASLYYIISGISDEFYSSDESYSYPAKEYRLSIKTTTIDDQTDTTYVITKIK